jgi:regulator of sigma E protease
LAGLIDSYLSSIVTIAEVALGLGFVSFVHELGHFLLAKWNDVKVEKFSIGFGPAIYSFRRGETEYVLAWLPLGGFVKMLGEGIEESETKSTDPRAYPNKSVGARMAIISAGVIMNIFLAVGCYAYMFTKPRQEHAAALGAVSAGSLAYDAGLRPGDEILAIDGERDIGFNDLKRSVLFSAEGQILHLEVKRPGQEGPLAVAIQPQRDATTDAPAIGILPGFSLQIARFDRPAGTTATPAYTPLAPADLSKKVDVLAAAGPDGQSPTPLASELEYERLLAAHAERPIKHVIERCELLANGESGKVLERFEVTFPANHVVDLGCRFEIEGITGISKDSAADKAGFRKGDRIVKVDGSDDLDPIDLPDRCYRNAGKSMSFEVERADGAGARRIERLTATPDDTPPRRGFVLPGEAVDVAGLGLSYPVRTRIAAVRAGSPAARAGLKPGQVISAIAIPDPKAQSDRKGLWAWVRNKLGWAKKATTFEFKERVPGWYSVFIDLQGLPIQEVELTVDNASQPIRITPEIDLHRPNSWRGLQFRLRYRELPAQSLGTALVSGYHEALQSIGVVFATFRSLAQRRVSTKHLGGPIAIFSVASAAAGQGFTELVYFLGFLSINLAVLNFLPIPPLDGGQMAFLIAEKVRGRPLPESAVLAGSWIGLFLVLCLMIFVTYQDIFRWVVG